MINDFFLQSGLHWDYLGFFRVGCITFSRGFQGWDCLGFMGALWNI